MRNAMIVAGMMVVVGAVSAGSVQAAEPCEPGLLWGPGQAEADPSVTLPVSFTRWDPDGPGPQREWLVFGSGFGFSSGLFPTYYGCVFAWDGGQYRGIGPNSAGAPTGVTAVGNWNGTLVAGGTLSPTNHVVAWDGSQWAPVATNIKAGTLGALTIFRGELIATGRSNSVEGLRLTDNRISPVMVLRGGQWEPLGPVQPGVGRDLIEYGGDLILGGSDSQRPMVRRWDGSQWISMTPSDWSGTEIRRFTVFDGRLIAVGRVRLASATQNAIALVWNGTSWDRLGAEQGPEGYSVAVHDDALWVTCSTGGGLTAGLYRWDRRAWTKYLPPGVTFMGFGSPSCPLVSWDGDLVVCGASVTSSVAAPSATATRSVLRITNGRLQSLAAGVLGAASSQFYASAGFSYAGRLFVGGQVFSGGFERNSGIVAWDGVNWGDPYRVTSQQTIYGFAAHPTGLLAYGEIKLVPGPSNTSLPAWGIVRWDGTSWAAFGDATNVTSAAIVPVVLVDDNELFAVRIESRSPSTSTVRRWTESGWEQLGGVANGSVSGLLKYNGLLLATGFFSQIGSSNTGNVAQWNGTEWVRFGTGDDDSIVAVLVHQGELYGIRSGPTASYPVTGVFKWSGASWLPVGSGATVQNPRCLLVYRGELFVGGTRTELTSAGAPQVPAVARWNGSTWSNVDIGPFDSGGAVNELLEHNGELVILGGYRRADLQGVETVRRWSNEKNPWIAWQPHSADTVCGGSTTFRARVANGYAISSAAWYRGSEPVVPDRAAGVRVEFSGGNSILRLDNVDASDAGEYRCVFTHSCGTLESAVAALTVTGACCPGDLTLDGIVDDADFTGFAAAYDAMECAAATMPAGCSADLNNDGLVDDSDFGVFVGAYDALVCD